MRIPWRAALLAGFLVSLRFSDPALGADGDLDPSFGAGGKVVTGFDVPAAVANAVVVQPDGKIVAAGWLFDDTANVDFAVARYTPEGALDSTFGSGGRVRTDFYGRFDIAYALAIEPDGRILVAGSATTAANEVVPAIARYLPSGILDATFNLDGKVTGNFFGILRALVLLPGGKFVAAGSGFHPATSGDFVLSRYNGDGSLDSSFGIGGIVQTDFDGLRDEAWALLRLLDGGLLAVGTSETNVTADDLALARYDSEGQPDTTFGSSGRITIDFFGRGDVGTAAALQPDGKIVIAASILTATTSNDMSAVRVLPDGTLDPGFGTAGRAVATFPGTDAIAYAIAVQRDEKIVAAGLAFGTNLYDFALARFHPTGVPDDTFGSGGSVVTDFFGGADASYGVALQPDGRIVAAGSAISANVGSMALARYLGAPVSTPSPACPRPAGWWKSHPEEWPLSTLTLGSQSYSAGEIAALLTKPVKGDASLILARDLIAAKFSVAAGADSVPLVNDIASADALLAAHAGKLPYRVSPGTSQGRAMIDLAGRLASLNNRRSSPGCPGS